MSGLRPRLSNTRDSANSEDLDNKNDSISPRRSVRKRNKPQKYGQFFETSPSKQAQIQEHYSDDDLDFAEPSLSQKPTALFSKDDVEGLDMFKFKSRHTKLDLQNKVKDVIMKSPMSTLTSPGPKSARKSLLNQSKEDAPKNAIDAIRKSLFRKDDVEGQDMFKFKSRHTKLDIQIKVKDVSGKSPESALFSPGPKSARKSLLSQSNEATPKHVKDSIKKRIIKEVESDASEDSDFSGTNSDFVPEESDDEEGLSSASDDSEVEAEIEKPKTKITEVNKKLSRMMIKESEYVFTSDNYFMMHYSKKIQTSDHTLSRLKNVSSNDNTAEDTQISEEHKTAIAELNISYEHLFSNWLYVLSENFNLVLYGVGSKRSIIHQFITQRLHGFPCVVVNGFFPSLTIKSILETIITDLLEINHIPKNVGDVVSLIDTELNENDIHLFLIINNIDGVMLRNSKAQSMLASLSQISNVHTIATIDHINAPLLWDHTKLSKFRFTWWDVTTFLPYTEETSYENNIMSHRSGALQISSLTSVYKSLTSNARGILKIIIQYQLENYKNPHYEGLPFKDLYSKTREQFLVSSDVALRAQLTEFLDHKLVKMKRTFDGNENLVIPIDNVLLHQFLEEQDG